MWKHKKQFGQHFLTDNHAIAKMCEASNIQEENVVLEIGPGQGVLTSVLLERGATVYAIEKDNDLIPFLQEKFSSAIETKKLIIIHKDIRDIEQSDLPQGEYKLVANIPYYITGEIIRTFLTAKNHPSSITLLVQEEVARRICSDGKSNLLRLSVCVYGTPKYIKKVKAGSFNPPPKVDSAIIYISNISRDAFATERDETVFFEVLHVAFNQKRKTILKTLGGKYEKEVIENILNKLGVSPKERPEDVQLDIWLRIAREIAKEIASEGETN